MPGVGVFVGDTDQEAREIEHDLQLSDQDFDKSLAELGRPFAWHDFRQYDLDAPFPQEALVYAERGFRTGAEKIAKLAKGNGWTLRQTVQFISSPKPTPFAGSPETVATEIQRWFDGRALDGLNIHVGHPAQWRRFLAEVVPILQDRGVYRTEYESTTLRGNLGLPIPENRYTATRQAPSLLKI
jgi:alkanesulfonate monooxygenase SsuD/methylene tetrahydromethanopterin reductase-like flavin-dependent oxidoreductase (luciferase family)